MSHHPDGVAVLLPEEGNGPPLLGLLGGEDVGADVVASSTASLTMAETLPSSSAVMAEK